jgi:hypothetical protein
MRPIMFGWLLAAAFLSAACYTMRPVTLDEIGRLRPAQIRATRDDQSVVVVYNPQVFGTKLVGFVEGKYQEMRAADLKQFRMRAPARGQTAALIVGAALGVATFAYLVTSSGDYMNPCDTASSEFCSLVFPVSQVSGPR